MSVCLDEIEGVSATLVNGSVAFGFHSEEDVSRWVQWLRDHPDGSVDSDHGPISVRHILGYVDRGALRAPLTDDDARAALRRYGWLI